MNETREQIVANIAMWKSALKDDRMVMASHRRNMDFWKSELAKLEETVEHTVTLSQRDQRSIVDAVAKRASSQVHESQLLSQPHPEHG